MSLPADLSVMDLLLDREDNLLSFDKDLISDEMKFCLDSKSINSDDWTNGVDFLDSLLEMESDKLELDDSKLLGDDLPTPAPESVAESSSCSDSVVVNHWKDWCGHLPSYSWKKKNHNVLESVPVLGWILTWNINTQNKATTSHPTCPEKRKGFSCDQQLSPMVQDVEEEDDVEEVIFEEEVYTEPDSVVKEEIIEVEDEELIDFKPTVERMNAKHEEPVVKMNVPRVAPAAPVPTVRVKPVSVAAPRRVIRVTPLQSSNPRSILIPVNNVGGVRTIKIINAGAKGQPAISVRAKQLLNNSAVIRTIESDNAPSDRSEHNSLYPRLRLTGEERRLMIKEGVTLPSHYPLTKHEERELKRIRRKIRNKISAQDSRKRKKEYVDGLEDRVKQCTEENMTLLKRLKVLQTQNQSLSAQLRRLHAAVARGTAQTAQPATCLMVLVLSLALVMAPNLRPSRSATHHDLDLPDSKQSPLAGRSRSLLFSKPSDQSPIETAMNQDTINEEEIDKALLANLEGMLQFKKAKLDDHDYSQAVLTENKGTKRYIDPDVDDSWPPPKIPRADVSNRPEEAVHNKTRAPREERKYIVELPE